jgi:hypothetical protein
LRIAYWVIVISETSDTNSRLCARFTLVRLYEPSFVNLCSIYAPCTHRLFMHGYILAHPQAYFIYSLLDFALCI